MCIYKSGRKTNSNTMVANQTRREILSQIGIATGTSVVGLSAFTDQSAAHQVDSTQHTILEDTIYETNVYTLESPNEGETVFIFGGIHGNERGGIEAAHLATEYMIDRGTLIVIPEANKAAVERNNNHGPNGDLNRQFPIGSTPTTTIARKIWETFVDANPDYLLDLHNATGIYGSDGVGQSIFPTSDVISAAESTITTMNTTHLPETDSLSNHAFRIGPTISEQYPLLIHKAAADQNVSGWLVEVTRTALDIEEMTFLHDMITRELLAQLGIVVVSEPVYSNPF